MYRYYFQILQATDVMAYGYLHLILQFGWKKVSIITHNEPVFVRVSTSSTYYIKFLTCMHADDGDTEGTFGKK